MISILIWVTKIRTELTVLTSSNMAWLTLVDALRNYLPSQAPYQYLKSLDNFPLKTCV